MSTPSTAKVIAAFASVYIIWGSTYLAIYYAIDTIPPFFMAGIRFLIASIALFTYAIVRGKKLPNARQLVYAAISGALLFLCGNGFLSWAELHVPTGLASLVVATVPLWMVIAGWIFNRKIEWDTKVFLGLFLGFVGVFFLMKLDQLFYTNETIPENFLIGVVIILIGSICWAIGSVFAKKYPVSESVIMGFSFQIFFGAVFLLLTSLFIGEWKEIDLESITLQSASAVTYLIIFGTLIANTAYMWLLKIKSPVLVGTYAYVNPLIAVLLGGILLNEPLTARVLLSLGLILVAVYLVNMAFYKNARK